MNNPIKPLISEIEREEDRLDKLINEKNEIFEQIDSTPNSISLRALGSLLHDFYTGVEQIFEKIALEMDGSLPEGDQWHRRLLARMSTDIDEVRPAVISEQLEEHLDEYLRFRHVFRHSYGFELKWDKCRHLVENLESMHTTLIGDLNQFKTFLEELDNGL